MCKNLNYLEEPLTLEELKALANENDYIKDIIIAISDKEIIENDKEGFLDLISKKTTGSICLREINEKMIGCITEKKLILYSVTGNIADVIEDLEFSNRK